METQDRQAIEGLFERLGTIERQSPPRDPAAESFIGQRINQQPAAPYFMAQTIVVQEAALNAAQERIEALEDQVNRKPPSSGGGFFSSLFGGGNTDRTSAQTNRRAAAPALQGGGGGGFLAGAAQTAMGVAGGVLLGNAIGGMFAGDPAEAATPEEEPTDQGGFDDGGDAGDMEF